MGARQFQSFKDALQQIGADLDGHLFPRVLNGGVVVPSAASVDPSTSGAEKQNVFKPARRSEAGPWPRAAGWQRSAGRSWPSGAAAPIIGSAGQQDWQEKLNAVREVYPSAQLWTVDDGFWLVCKSAVLEGLPQHAQFIVGLAPRWSVVRSWAFWLSPLTTPKWIGPRHTNFFDGSICAFEPADGTWTIDQSLVSLIDLYTVWALRHLFLEYFGRWPGYQAVHLPVERILEFDDDEYCGCGTTKKYKDCCKTDDRSRCRVGEAVRFVMSPRCPPRSILELAIEGLKRPPALRDVLI